MNEFLKFLSESYTPYHAVENAAAYLTANGFTRLFETDEWKLKEGEKYFVVRCGGLVAFTLNGGKGFKIAASHTDSPCFALKENPAWQGDFTRLNCEPYGGGLWYTFFDRPLKIAGRLLRDKEGKIEETLYVSEQRYVIPSLAIHMNRSANESFAPNLQNDLPLYALGKAEFEPKAISGELYAVCDEQPFFSGANGEFLSAPRLDNLVSAYASLRALAETPHEGTCICALFNSEEIGSRTVGGAASDLLKNTLERISISRGKNAQAHLCALASSFMISLDNAHSLHPNHAEACDPTNRPAAGGGIVIKSHAGGAYTTNAVTSSVVKKILNDAGVKWQTFHSRSDMRSGSTLGAISLSQFGVPSVDLGIAQLAMHSAVETMCVADLAHLIKGLTAFYDRKISLGKEITIE